MKYTIDRQRPLTKRVASNGAKDTGLAFNADSHWCPALNQVMLRVSWTTVSNNDGGVRCSNSCIMPLNLHSGPNIRHGSSSRATFKTECQLKKSSEPNDSPHFSHQSCRRLHPPPTCPNCSRHSQLSSYCLSRLPRHLLRHLRLLREQLQVCYR